MKLKNLSGVVLFIVGLFAPHEIAATSSRYTPQLERTPATGAGSVGWPVWPEPGTQRRRGGVSEEVPVVLPNFSVLAAGISGAVSNNDVAAIQACLDAGANVNVGYKGTGKPPLYLAADNGLVDMVKVLLTVPGIDKDVQYEYNQTPLHAAARNGHTEVVRLLVDAGADVTTRDENNRTPLHLAAWNGRTDVVTILLAAGAEVDALDGNNTTPLYLATAHSQVAVVKVLLAAHANPNLEAPLYAAALHGNVDMVRELLASGADWTLKCDKETPLDVAYKNLQFELQMGDEAKVNRFAAVVRLLATRQPYRMKYLRASKIVRSCLHAASRGIVAIANCECRRRKYTLPNPGA